MASDYRQWSGEEWQEHVLLLLKRHYGPGKFQAVPDGDRGDAGLEGFSNDGCAFQCYAPQEPLSVQQRAEKHKRKLYTDIRKFRENRVLLQTLLGPIRIRSWILVVPRFDSKDVVSYAENQAALVRLAGLPYAATDFFARVTDGDEFAIEREELIRVGLAKINVPLPSVASEEIDRWSQFNAGLVRVLDGKLARMKPGSGASVRAALRAELVRHYVSGQNALAKLHDDYGELYERVQDLKANRERFLLAECMTASALPTEVLRDTVSKYEESLVDKVPGIDGYTAEVLVWEAVADWLFRCPLDFEEGTR